ncbi:host-nuclease inhibitor Gam family protein [Clostridium cagae]|uniref:host-nuclease inhibitor Gam family protein n=1 Tax=Clostridium cagae TaxID=2080751 RepID=UPI003F75B3AF
MKNTLLKQDLQEERREGFKIENLKGATWAFRKLRAIGTKKTEIEAVAAEEIARIEAWKEEQLKQYDDDTEFFEGAISVYFIEERAKDKKFKLSTPYGKVSSRKSKKWIYEDEAALKEYVKENEIEAIRVKEELDKTDLKKICKDGVNTETGEILPGVRIEETETITVKAE